MLFLKFAGIGAIVGVGFELVTPSATPGDTILGFAMFGTAYAWGLWAGRREKGRP